MTGSHSVGADLSARATTVETITTDHRQVVMIPLCPDCDGRPAAAARLFQSSDMDRFCSCPFDEAHPR
jgi:hypothetical protein